MPALWYTLVTKFKIKTDIRFTMSKTPSIAVTAATGQLGRLVIEQLVTQTTPQQIAAVVRNPAKAADIASRGVTVRQADYTQPDQLQQAFLGIEKLLLISSSEVGQRALQHQNAIAAAKHAGVKTIIYTSLLHADKSALSLAAEHVVTERAIKDSGLSHIILRNGWYAENYTGSIKPALENGALVGSAGEGRLSLATRGDYAAAAVAALTGRAKLGHTYELAGDEAVTLADLTAEVSRQTGKDLPYRDLPEADYAEILVKVGLPPPLAAAIARWDVDAANGALFDDGRELSRLIGRPTTPLTDYVEQALKA